MGRLWMMLLGLLALVSVSRADTLIVYTSTAKIMCVTGDGKLVETLDLYVIYDADGHDWGSVMAFRQAKLVTSPMDAVVFGGSDGRNAVATVELGLFATYVHNDRSIEMTVIAAGTGKGRALKTGLPDPKSIFGLGNVALSGIMLCTENDYSGGQSLKAALRPNAALTKDVNLNANTDVATASAHLITKLTDAGYTPLPP